MSLYSTQTTAYMRVDQNGNHMTDVRVDGVLIKSIPTDKSQIREERVSLLWMPSSLAAMMLKLNKNTGRPIKW